MVDPNRAAVQDRLRDGICMDSDGTLAGSDLNMATAVRNARDLLDLDIASAIRMAFAWPAEFLGLSEVRGSIGEDLSADLLILDDDVNVIRSWIEGREVDGSNGQTARI